MRRPWQDGGSVTRRQALLGASGVAAGVAAFGAGAGDAVASGPGEEGTWLAGVVDHVESDRVLWIAVTGGSAAPVAVDVEPGATVLLTGGPGPLSGFVAGDEVVVVGAWNADRFSANDVEYDYETVATTITGRDGATLQTNDGVVVLGATVESRNGLAAGRRLASKPVDALGAGDRIVLLGHRNQQTKIVTADVVGVVAS